MKNRIIAVLGISMFFVLLCANISFASVVVKKNDNSRTGYTVSFSLEDEKATNVSLLGGFTFYHDGDVHLYGKGFSLAANDDYHNYLVQPEDWKADNNLRHIFDMEYSSELKRDSSGKWIATMDLPGGCYMYQFSVSEDSGISYTPIADPDNTAQSVDWGSNQTRSKFFVPYDEKQGEEDYYDWSWTIPDKNSSQGTINGITYDGKDGEQRAEIYLPAGYDESREDPYPVLYLAHGGGGDEGDWFYQGNAGNILDNLIANGDAEPFVMVTMNNGAYTHLFRDDPDVPSEKNNPEYYEYCYDNIKNYLIPYIEEKYNVGTTADKKALAGLSQGAKLSNLAWINDPDTFGYYGMFSCSTSFLWPDQDDYSEYKKAKVYLAAGFADNYMISGEYHTDVDCTLIGLKEKLDEDGIIYNNGTGYVTVAGDHDWFTWQQILKKYFTDFLWKA